MTSSGQKASHRDATTKKLIADRLRLTVYYLPAYAPILNPVEGLWSALKRSLANLAPHGVDALAALGKTRPRPQTAVELSLSSFTTARGASVPAADPPAQR
ncbi:transposase [Catenulispora sp. GAS73]|uniref:transposase n=1 Tax=Catenulispora sp. GAS73 TaxID=3156269 RepID=UPI003513C4A6